MFKKIATGLASTGLLLSAVVPAFAVGDITISGNNMGSTNKVTVNETCTQTVSQTNNTKVGLNLTVTGNTGNNTANGNMGGTTKIDTGAVDNTVKITVTGGDNTADTPTCCCDGKTNGKIDLTGNNVNSTNTAKVTTTNTTTSTQKSKAKLWLKGKVDGKTGNNKTNHNMGSGTTVTTDSVTNNVTVDVAGGSSTLN